MKNIGLYLTALLISIPLKAYCQADALIEIDPQTSVSVHGILELDRKKYFNLGHGGHFFEAKVADPQQVQTYTEEYSISFGRNLGLVKNHTVWEKKVFEDPQRPGFADIDRLVRLIGNKDGASNAFKKHFSPNLDVANHEFPNAYPDFMGHFTSTEDPEKKYPLNHEAAAELVAAVLAHGYNDWSRPATYEPINEPHWSLWNDG
jgi:hypothetical protein